MGRDMTQCSHTAWTTPCGLPTCPTQPTTTVLHRLLSRHPFGLDQSGNIGESTTLSKVSSIRESTCPVVFIVAEHVVHLLNAARGHRRCCLRPSWSHLNLPVNSLM